MIKTPPYLKKGDTIGITCPAGYMAKEKAQTCIDTLQQWGYQVMVGKTLGSNSANYFSGTDEERLNELQAMLDDDSIHAILCGRGGYGTSRIIDRLDFKKFKRKPKWIIGFSDITVLHNHIFTTCKTASIHAPMASAFNDGGAENEYVLSLKQMLAGKKNKYTSATHAYNQQGNASGELVGGNLSLLAHLTGTPSDVNTKNKLLFIEDIGEYLYGIDRMLYQLKRSGKLDNLAGLIIGGFTDMKDTDRPFGKNIDEVIYDIVKDYAYPICFHFPVSHGTENYALKIGGTYQLTVGKTKVQLSEQ
ncbi:MAG: LD-carboxypeptidase [Ferruginibacter sp.]|uniref:S66 peptidase family protein n=1 Tax=Ferruginibacter sp. TaxID=1940288 RepID=UPI0026588DA5|nr:LD-carboxypeptidase [Ferruginibacter sp.]MDB5275293.1 LD-carboxypeptidase [Ferruginibacter sp.]